MAVNVTITAAEMDIDEIRREAEAAQWTDNPDCLRNIITRIAQLAIEAIEGEAEANEASEAADVPLITEITATHPHGFGGHEFEYQPADDLHRCVRCGGYEVSLRRPDGTIPQCPGPADDGAEAYALVMEKHVTVCDDPECAARTHRN